MTNHYYTLDPSHTDSTRMRKEREKARKIKKSQAWLTKLNQGICHYCLQNFEPKMLTMDHIVPLARGGSSTIGNLVPACKPCNLNKKLSTPVESILNALQSESP